MKKTILKTTLMVIMVIMLFFVFSGVALAETLAVTQEKTQETAQETEIMSTKTGAELRFLQLSRSISINILSGEAVIEAIYDENPDADLSRAEEILEEMRLLVEEIENIEYTDKNLTELAELFIVIKKESVDLAKEFRIITGDSLSIEMKQMLNQKISIITKEQNKGIDTKIKNAILAHNSFMIRKIGSLINVDWNELANRVMNGSMNILMAKEQMKNTFNYMNKEEIRYAQARVLEEQARNRIFAQISSENANKGLETTLQEREQIRERIISKTGVINSEEQGNSGEEKRMSEENNEETGNKEDNDNNGEDSTGTNSANSGGNENSGSETSGSDSGSTDTGGSDGGTGGDNGGNTGNGGGNGGGN